MSMSICQAKAGEQSYLQLALSVYRQPARLARLPLLAETPDRRLSVGRQGEGITTKKDALLIPCNSRTELE